MAESVQVFGIRHHGPGSARSLVRSLQAMAPDVILIEGPPEANEVLPLAAIAAMRPPVALLIYAPESPQAAAYYPFAVFSPEWQAIQYGLSHQIPIRMIDLPQTHQLALQVAESRPESEAPPEPASESGDAAQKSEVSAPDTTAPETEAGDRPPEIRHDPLFWLAQAAGYSDSERWWEALVEQRQDSTDVFVAIQEAITELRQTLERDRPLPTVDTAAAADPQDLREAQREAFMRQSLRQAQKDGFQQIAVVCGAWHVPALTSPLPPAKQDSALLKGLPKIKVEATWVPWTYSRLALRSGYGAGIHSPGWYHHLWTARDQITTRWLTQVARRLRQEDLDASSASVIEAVRLAEALAALRDRPLPGLDELNEAAQTVLCFGDEMPMHLIHERLIISDRLGHVPPETPMVPILQDFRRLQRRLKLPERTEPKKPLELDLRQPTGLERSYLLHRLRLLNILWGDRQRTSSKGTFKEAWRLDWKPELAIAFIEASQWGNTIYEAASHYASHRADTAPNLPTLTELLDQVLLAALPQATTHLMERLQEEAAVASDVVHLMGALPPLANLLRYSDVRQTDAHIVSHVVDGLVVRICIGLPLACASLNDAAAGEMFKHLVTTHSTLKLLQNEGHLSTWRSLLQQMADQETLHGLLAGRCCRLLLDDGLLSPEETARRMGLALSLAVEPVHAAAWVEGFLQGSGLMLLHDDAIWQVLDRWVTSLGADTFVTLLPLLRRTFATFPLGERRQMADRVQQGGLARGPQTASSLDEATFDRDRADAVLPLVAQLLGLRFP